MEALKQLSLAIKSKLKHGLLLKKVHKINPVQTITLVTVV